MNIEEALAEYERQCEYLPEVREKPCRECPWLRSAAQGYLGPLNAKGWIDRAHGEGAIECHMTVIESEQSWEEVRQCAGAAIYRANVCKSPRNPLVAIGEVDRETVFATPMEFVDHHERKRP